MIKNIKFVIIRFVFSSSKCTKIRFRPGLRPGPRWGSLRRSLRPPSRLGRDIAISFIQSYIAHYISLLSWGGGYPCSGSALFIL